MYKKPLIFVSHIHSEAKVALKLTNDIYDSFLEGVNFFNSSDAKSIIIGDDWLSKIRNAIKESCIILVLISPESVNNHWINFEAGAGWLEKRVVPICYPGINPSDLPYPLAGLQAIKLQDPENIQLLYSLIASEAKLKVPSKDWTTLANEISKICEIKFGPPNGSYQCRMFESSEHWSTQEFMLKCLETAGHIKFIGLSLNFLWKVSNFELLKRRLSEPSFEAEICLGDVFSDEVELRIKNEPEHHIGISSNQSLIERFRKIGLSLKSTRLDVRVFKHYPTFSLLIFDDNYFLFNYPFQAYGNLSPCFYWCGNDSISKFYLNQFHTIFKDATPI